MRRSLWPIVVLTAVVGSLAAAASARSAEGAPAKRNLFEDSTDIGRQLRKTIPGPIMILELTIDSDSADVDVQDPRKTENLDRYTYRQGKLGKPAPIKLSGDYTQKDLDAALFSLDLVDFSLVPKLIDDARARLKMPDAELAGVTLKRDFPFGRDLRWSVSFTDDRHVGMVEYDLKGKKKSQHKE